MTHNQVDLFRNRMGRRVDSVSRIKSYCTFLPIPLCLGLLCFFVFDDVERAFESYSTLLMFNTLFLTVLPLIAAYLSFRGYSASGHLSLIVLGNGAMALGLGSLLAALGPFVGGGSNMSVTVHNTAALCSGFFHLVGSVSVLHGSNKQASIGRRRMSAGLTFALNTMFLVLLFLGAVKGLTPTFFVQDVGPTHLRQVVLGASIGCFTISASLLAAVFVISGSRFLLWYWSALALIAVGLLCVFVQRSVDSDVGWLGRIAQSLGGAYLLAAAFTALRDVRDRNVNLVTNLWTFFFNRLELTVAERTQELVEANRRLTLEIASRKDSENAVQRSHDELERRVLDRTEKLRAANERLLQEVSERNAADQSLRESEEKFRLFMDNSPAIAWLKDEKGRYVYVSRALEKLFEGQVTDWLGRTDYDLWPEDIAQTFRENDQAVLTSGRTMEITEDAIDSYGNRCFLLNHKFLFEDASGRKYVAGIGIDITERKKAEEALQTSKAQLEAALEAMTDAVFISDVEGNFVEFNEAFAAFHRFRNKEECAKTLNEYPVFLDVFKADGEIAPLEQWAVPRALRGETAMNAEYTLRRKDTGETWIGSYNFAPIRDQSGAIVGSVVTGRDITESKRTEEALRNSERMYGDLVLNIPSGVYRFRMKAEGGEQFDFISDRWCLLNGLRREDVLSNPRLPFSVIHPEEIDAFLKSIETARRTVEPFVWEGRILVNNETKWFRIESRPTLVENGDMIWSGVQSDITERKKAENKLRENEERLSLSLQVSNAGRWEWNIESEEVFFDDRFHTILGYAVGELPTTIEEWLPYHHPDDMPIWMAKAEAYLRGDSPYYESEHRIRSKDGTWKWIFTRGKLVKLSPTGSIKQFIGLATDITERKQADEALKRSEERLHLALDAAHAGTWEWDLRTNENFWSEELWKLYGLEPNSCNPSYEAWLLTIHPLDRAGAEQAVKDAAANGTELNTEWRTCEGTGRQRRLMSRGRPLRNANGEVIRFIGTVIDITERKRAEEELAESKEELRLTLEATTDGIWKHDLKTNHVEYSPNYYTMLGYEPYEYPATYENWVELIHPEDRSRTLRAVQEYLKVRKGLFENECRLRTKSGDYRWIRSKAKTVGMDAQGESLRLIGSHEDITERKTADDALRKSQSFLNSVIDQSPYSMWISDAKGTLVRTNKALRDLLQISDDEVVGKYNILKDHIVDKQGFMPLVRRVFEKGDTVRFEINHNDQQTKTIPISLYTSVILDVTIFPIRDSYDKITGAVIQHIDISDRKQAEEGLKEREQFLTAIVENIPHMIFVKEAEDLRFVRVNKAGEELIGYAREELVGKNDYDFFPSEEADSFTAKDREILEKRVLQDIPEETIHTRDKGNRILHTKKIPMYDEHGIPQYVLGISEDITERKTTEENLKKSEQFLRQTEQIARVGGWMANPQTDDLYWTDGVRKIIEVPLDYQPGLEEGLKFYKPQYIHSIKKMVNDTLNYGTPHLMETEVVTTSGKHLWAELRSLVRVDESGRSLALGTLQDITERKTLEQQFLQAQKMEAVGTLAGGIAHDFNNLLQVVLGYSELMLDDHDFPKLYRDDLKKISQAAKNGADLVQRLLTFSRKTDYNPRPINLNRQIEQLKKMLARTIPKMVAIELVLAPNLEKINADPTQVDQILMNLAVNARDAMPKGGRLVIETENVTLDKLYSKTRLAAAPGAHVLLSVSDTGEGMDQKTLEHIFDPFYTTKPAGKGTGLGLAMVYGIVKQHGGHVMCYSEPGRGTTFKIYFPAIFSEEDEKEI